MQTGKSTLVRANHLERLCGQLPEDSVVLNHVCERTGVCSLSVCTDLVVCVCVCVCALSRVCMRASSMAGVHVRSRWRVLLRWSVNLNKHIAPVCMYSPVNRAGSVTRRPRALLYLPSKTAVVLDLLLVLYILTFYFFAQLETWRTAVLVNNNSWCALCACKCPRPECLLLFFDMCSHYLLT